MIENGDFVYNPRKSTAAPYGPVNIYHGKDLGIISPLYLCFQVDSLDPDFLNFRFKSHAWHQYMYENGDSGARHDRVSIKDEVFFAMPISFPTKAEQKKIVSFLMLLEERIAIQNKVIERYQSLIRAINQKQFRIVREDISISPIKLSVILRERKEYCENDGTYPHASLSKEGVDRKSDRYDRDFLVRNNEKKYKVTRLNDICYNPANLKFGVISRNKIGPMIFSPIYITFEVASNYDPEYIEYYLTNPDFVSYMLKYEQGTVYERMAVSPEDFLSESIKVPSLPEQQRYAAIISAINRGLSMERKIANDWLELKQSILRQMFI